MLQFRNFLLSRILPLLFRDAVLEQFQQALESAQIVIEPDSGTNIIAPDEATARRLYAARWNLIEASDRLGLSQPIRIKVKDDYVFSLRINPYEARSLLGDLAEPHKI